MKNFAIAAAMASSLSLAACTTPGYNQGYNNNGQVQRAGTGAVLGAAAGAVAAQIIPGVNTAQGAIAGAVLGGVAGLVINNRQYYRTSQGQCYWVDQYNQPHYDNSVRC